MQIQVKGKQVDVGDSLRGHVETTLEALVGKYFDRAIDATVVLSREAHQFRADLVVHPRRGFTVQSSGAAADPYVAFDQARERIAKQLRRYKRRLETQKTRSAGDDDVSPARYAVLAADGESEAAADETQPMVVADLATDIPTCTVSGAVMRLDLTDQPAILFKNAAHGGINMVYRRTDGHIGWIDPADAARTRKPS